MAKQQNITIDQGTDVQFEYLILNNSNEQIDLTDYEARAKMRKHWASANSVEFSASISGNTVILTLTNEETGELDPGRYVYDVEIISDSDQVSRVVEGICTVRPSSTY